MEPFEPFNMIFQTAEDGLGDTVKPRLLSAQADLERVLVIDDADNPLTLADERIENAIRENNARLVIIDPLQAFLGANVDMNRANEVRPIFRRLADVAQAANCAIVMIGHLNKLKPDPPIFSLALTCDFISHRISCQTHCAFRNSSFCCFLVNLCDGNFSALRQKLLDQLCRLFLFQLRLAPFLEIEIGGIV